MDTDPNKIIDALGGTKKVASLCGRSKGAVSQWRHTGIPDGLLRYLRAAYPEKFAEIEAAGAAEQEGACSA